MRYILILIIIIQIQIICQTDSPKREFRGIWIATVENIDWPSKKFLSPERQKEEFINIISHLKKDKINAVFIQVRPSCDAFYQSETEPWSEWLTGIQGKEPEPFYDPLIFIVEECHKRGIEIHAWFNPFRSVVNTKTSNITGKHISKTHPDWNIVYGKYKWLNPGLPEVRNYVTGVVLDVVRKYNIDGVHFDDYFYPYPVKNTKFRDEKTFVNYSRGIKDIESWRRDNINLFLKQVSDSIRKVRSGCIFGISPFGIWKNNISDISGSNTKGSESYYKTYSDSKKWLSEGWIDYLVPQLYWHIGNSSANYKILAEWWSNNSFGKNIYLGQAVYKIANDYHEDWMNGNQIQKQIRLNRSLKNISGNVFFNTSTFLKNPMGLKDSLEINYYKYYAITPVINGKEDNTPLSPVNGIYNITNGKTLIKWEKPIRLNGRDTAVYFVIYRFPGMDTVDISRPGRIADIVYCTESSWVDTLPEENKSGFQYVVTSLNNYKNESNDLCRIIVPSGAETRSSETHIAYSNPDSLDVIRMNGSTRIIIKLDKMSLVTVKVFDFYGNEIKQLLHEYKSAGNYEYELEEKEIKSKGYIVQMKTKGYYSSKRIVIMN
jgi:uncharacterized lipoprotein YddW (UPF0748 family)